MVAPIRPNYLPKIEEAVQAGTYKPTPGKVNHIDVRHDGWCAIFKGGVCNCDPEVSFRPAPARK